MLSTAGPAPGWVYFDFPEVLPLDDEPLELPDPLLDEPAELPPFEPLDEVAPVDAGAFILPLDLPPLYPPRFSMGQL